MIPLRAIATSGFLTWGATPLPASPSTPPITPTLSGLRTADASPIRPTAAATATSTSRTLPGLGDDENVIESGTPKNVEDWSRDTRWMVYNEAVPNNSDDLVILPLDSRKPIDFLRTRFQEDKGRFSPDGKWLAYQSDESGRAEVYIQPFPPIGEKWQISNDQGGQPQWRGDGKELYYSVFTIPSRMMAVSIVAKDHTLHAGIPHLLFQALMQESGARNRWVVTPDGQKFLAVVPARDNLTDGFRVIVNWPSLLPKK